MNMQVREGFAALTEKEKQTLRLIVRGHDAKSTARSLGLSVHTINERLRDARRKMAVSSSREAARLLLEVEGEPLLAAPDLLGDTGIGEDAAPPVDDQGSAPIVGVRRPIRRSWIFGGFAMFFALGLLALAALPQTDSAPPPASVSADAPNPAVVDAARRFLALLDQGNWADSYQATATSFHKLNTLQVWSAASEKARTPLGAMVARTLVSQEDLPAPPHGYEVVKFRTRFANKGETLETVSLDREGGVWRVVGVTIG
jgi:DNA-binding CsgD family transcriptional regulator